MAGWYELSKSSNGQYWFVLKAGNGETILTREMYQSKASALAGIASVQTNCTYNERYYKLTSRDNRYYFVLKASNYQVIATSKMYHSMQSREIGIASVKANGNITTIKDNT